jgi:von Willebrand factor type D domain
MFTVDPILPQSYCGGSPCDYKVCAYIDETKPGCAKSDPWSHTCRKSLEDQIKCESPTGFLSASMKQNIPNGYYECQIVKAGEVAEFLFKDGAGCDSGSPLQSIPIGNGGSVSCQPSTSLACDGNGNIGKGCIWNVYTPTSCTVTGGGGGDPHFRTYDGTVYSYHGQCDLVMAHSSSFDHTLGLDVHARTEMIDDAWSLISNAGIRLGDDIIEFTNRGVTYVNNIKHTQFPIFIGGKYMVTKDVHVVESDKGDEERLHYVVDLSNRTDIFPANSENRIDITSYRMMMSIRVDAYIHDTQGMLGNHKKYGMVGRDGTTVLNKPNDMGAAWQVTDEDPILFHESRYPQYPESCIVPKEGGVVAQRRRLRSVSDGLFERAQIVCRKVAKDMYAFCIDDILLSGDIAMANGFTF